MKIRQMKWFGHLIRLPGNTQAKAILKYLNEETKRRWVDKGQAEKKRSKKT